MSDQSGGGGWWQAFDGSWYPPLQTDDEPSRAPYVSDH
jgi:hypothetical protein